MRMKRSTFCLSVSLVVCLITVNARASISLPDSSGKPQYLIETRRAGNFLGTIKVEMFPIIAPLHVANFDSLVKFKLYDSTAFHRVIPGFVIQGGDPNSKNKPRSTWGYGDPSQQTVPAEFSAVSHQRGILSAARSSDPNSATSQFFICVGNPTHLDGNYSAYGRVIEGMNIVDTIVSAPRDSRDNPLDKIEMFITKTGYNNSVPTVPVQLSPTAAQKGILTNHDFKWEPVADAVMYHLQVATDTNFNNIVYEVDASFDTYTVEGLEQGEIKHYWRVQSNNGGNLSSYSPVYTFTTAILAPTLASPANNSIEQSVDPVLQWNAVPGASSYRLHVATSSAFTVSSTVFNQAGITGTSYQLTGLQTNKKYYWKVKSATPEYEANFSSVWNFKTTTVIGLNEQLSGQAQAELYPNPLSDEAVLHILLPQSSAVKLVILDMQGKKLMEEDLGELGEGEHMYPVKAETFAAGLYQYAIEGEDFLLKGRFNVIR